MSTAAAKAVAAAFSTEVKLHALRRSKEGVVVSLVLHPQSVPEQILTAELGTRFMLAWVQIGDDEQPAEPGKVAQFPDRSRQAREHYQQSDAMEQARVRAAMLAKDERFRHWAFPMNTDSHTEKDVAEFIREACGIETRRMIATDDEAYRKFLALETEYKIAIGEIAAPR
jgi:hypothetical protein